jgi:hypothetical protein
MDEATKEHLEKHLKFPATGEEILSACNYMSDVGENDKMKFKAKIDPAKTYNSLDELTMDLS